MNIIEKLDIFAEKYAEKTFITLAFLFLALTIAKLVISIPEV